MTKAVFATKIDPSYDDLPEQRYHFPKTYLRAVEEARGDWIVYYEPRRRSGALSSRGGRQSYFGTARVVRIEPDERLGDHYYAYVEDFLPFDRPVPFKEGEHYYESGLRRDDGGTSKGAFGRSVRRISEGEYNTILRAGFAHVIGEEQPSREPAAFGFADEPATFERPIVERVTARPFRDAVFSSVVKTAYGNTCAMTGLKIINGGGRSEVQAAHIRPVSDSGTDSVRNGVALCATVHWVFDRGLLSMDDTYNILFPRHRCGKVAPAGQLRCGKPPPLDNVPAVVGMFVSDRRPYSTAHWGAGHDRWTERTLSRTAERQLRLRGSHCSEWLFRDGA